MKTYFNSAGNDGGIMCEGEAGMDGVFGTMKEIHQKSFEDLHGEYIERDNEKTCAIRLASNVFFEVM